MMNLLTYLLFTACLLSFASASMEDTLNDDARSRALLEEPTAEDFENMKSTDRDAWDKADHGGKRRRALQQTQGRALQQTYGTAYGRAKPVTTPTSSSLKVQPDGYDCLIARSSTGIADCSRNYAFVVPACCSSSLETTSTKCESWDNAQGTVCSAAARPYAACCFFRNQPEAACNVYQNTSVLCGTAKPGVACCSGGTCSLNIDGSGGTCKSTSKIGCCPA